jgi:hypothetical protein
VPEYAEGGVIPGNGATTFDWPLAAGEHVITAAGKVLLFDGQVLVDTGVRIDPWAALERLNEGRPDG